MKRTPSGDEGGEHLAAEAFALLLAALAFEVVLVQRALAGAAGAGDAGAAGRLVRVAGPRPRPTDGGRSHRSGTDGGGAHRGAAGAADRCPAGAAHRGAAGGAGAADGRGARGASDRGRAAPDRSGAASDRGLPGRGCAVRLLARPGGLALAAALRLRTAAPAVVGVAGTAAGACRGVSVGAAVRLSGAAALGPSALWGRVGTITVVAHAQPSTCCETQAWAGVCRSARSPGARRPEGDAPGGPAFAKVHFRHGGRPVVSQFRTLNLRELC